MIRIARHGTRPAAGPLVDLLGRTETELITFPPLGHTATYTVRVMYPQYLLPCHSFGGKSGGLPVGNQERRLQLEVLSADWGARFLSGPQIGRWFSSVLAEF